MITGMWGLARATQRERPSRSCQALPGREDDAVPIAIEEGERRLPRWRPAIGA